MQILPRVTSPRIEPFMMVNMVMYEHWQAKRHELGPVSKYLARKGFCGRKQDVGIQPVFLNTEYVHSMLFPSLPSIV